MDVVSWLQELGRSADGTEGFHAQPMYVLCSVALPIIWGLTVGFLMRLVEAIVGVELGRGGAH